MYLEAAVEDLPLRGPVVRRLRRDEERRVGELQGQMQRAVTRHLQPAAAKSVETSRRGVGVTERVRVTERSPSPRHLPPLAADGVESSCVEELRRANLKELRQVRRGLRKALDPSGSCLPPSRAESAVEWEW